MRTLNYKHLRYFWMVAKSGSIARASEQLHLTPHAISGQLAQFEDALGVALFDRKGRRLVLTDVGKKLLLYADSIFALGDDALEMLRNPGEQQAKRMVIGVADSVPKSVASRLLKPVLHQTDVVRLICHEGRLATLMADLAIHRLDAVLADRPMPPNVSVRAFSHLLGESAMSLFGAPELRARLTGPFPGLINGAPFLMPGEDVAFRTGLVQWLAANRLAPKVVAEFDDLALLKAFGQEGEGLFVAPTAIAAFICDQYKVEWLGDLPDVSEQLYLITTARRLTHPAMIAMTRVAREEIFPSTGAASARNNTPRTIPRSPSECSG